MQDEVNEKIIALCIQTTRMSTGVLKASMRKFLDGMSRQKQKRVQVKQAVKTGKAQEKGREKERISEMEMDGSVTPLPSLFI